MTDRKLGYIVLGFILLILIAVGSYIGNPNSEKPSKPFPAHSELLKEKKIAEPEEKTAEQKAKEAQEKAQQAKLKKQLQIQARKEFAKRLEFLNLDKLSLDTNVIAKGKNSEILIIQGALLGRALDWQLIKNRLYQSAANLGFKKVRFVNTIDHSWYEWKID